MPRRSAQLAGLLVIACGALVAESGAGYVAGGKTIWTIAGDGVACADSTTDCGDGPSAIDASLASPGGIAVDGDGTVFIADTANHRIRRLTASGSIATIAGTGAACETATASCGDGGPAVSAKLNQPRGLALRADGALYIADTGDHRVRVLSADGTIGTIAGSGEQCADPTTSCGDGGDARAAALNGPAGLAVDLDSGDVFIADAGNHRIRRVAAGMIATAAGTGVDCVSVCGDGGAASGAGLSSPSGVALDEDLNLYVADSGAHRVRKVARTTSVITTIAGDGSPCAGATSPCGDGGAPADGKLSSPLGVVAAGTVIYVADSGANKIRRLGSRISTIAGTGEPCAQPPVCGDGGAATAATLSAPAAIAADERGDLFVADSGAHLVRWLSGPGVPGSAPPVTGPPEPRAPAPEKSVAGAVTSPSVAEPAKRRRGPIVRCIGTRCRIAAADAATTSRLRSRGREALRGREWARVELRRGGRRWAMGSARTLVRALTLIPVRKLKAGRYRLRITQVSGDEQRRRDRIVDLR